MSPRTKNEKTRILTETELELMGIIWKLGEGTVNDVQGSLPPERKLAYTSVSTIMRILESKKVLGSRKAGRGHVYYPLLKKEDYEATSLNHLVDRVFEGTPTSLVRCLLDTNKLSASDLKEIQTLLSEKTRHT